MALERTIVGLQALIKGLPSGDPDAEDIRDQLQEQIDQMNGRIQEHAKEALIEQKRLAFTATVEEFNTQPHTPELTTRLWREKWWLASRDVMDAEYSKYVDVEIEVPDCDRSTEEIARLEHMREPRTLVYVPPELTTPEGLLTLGRMFSGLDAMSAMRSSVSESGGGWIDIESRAEPPHEPRDISGFSMDQRLKLLTSDAEGAFRRNGVSGQRLATYIIGSEMNNVLTGRHFDRGGRSLLLGTRINGEVIEAHTGSINSQVHLDLEPTGNGTVASGWRSEGRKRE